MSASPTATTSSAPPPVQPASNDELGQSATESSPGNLLTCHESTVRTISARVSHFHRSQTQFRIFHGGTNSTRQQSFHRDRIIDTSTLTRILSINRSANPPTVLCEPNLSFSNLLKAVLPYGLIPKVVPELPAITVGGAYSGTSGESSSYIHGFFEDTVRRVQIVLGDGEVVWAQRHGENAELLESAAGSFGTLGVVVALEVACLWLTDLAQRETSDPDEEQSQEKERESEGTWKYLMHLDVRPFQSTAKLMEALETVCLREGADGTQYVDAILFSATSGVLMLGKVVSATRARRLRLNPVRFTRAHDQWFYRYIEKRLTKIPGTAGAASSGSYGFSLAIPLYDYFFRYDRGAFWGGKHAFRYFCTPFNRVTRFLLDPLMHTTTMFHAFHESGLGSQFVVQDIGFPRSTVEKFLGYLEKELGFGPLWLCPLKRGGRLPMMTAGSGTGEKERALNEEVLINVGMWGPGRKTESEFVTVNRDIERVTKECWGAKCLYARAYYTEEEFWQIYDGERYAAVRSRWKAQGLPSVFDKTCINLAEVEKRVEKEKRFSTKVRRTRPLAGYYGAVKAMMGLLSERRAKEYMLAKK